MLLAAVTGCAARPIPQPGAARPAAPPAASVEALDFGRDTFAFPNLVRAERPGLNDGFANYCLVMTRSVSQFHRFARFAPGAAPVSTEAYAGLIRAVLDRPPWAPPLAEAERTVIPGFPHLRAFSRAHEGLLKAAFGSSLPSMLHWRTWRVGVAFSPAHQANVAGELRAEIDAGRPAPVMVTNFPEPDLLNHGVLVYAYRPGSLATGFLAYDPNDPGSPLELHFDAATRGFFVAPLPYSPPGRVRAFRLYTSPWF